MGEEKVNFVSAEEGTVNAVLVLLSFVFLVCGVAYITNSAGKQVNFFVVFSGGIILLAISFLCWGIQCIGIRRAIDYVNGKYENGREYIRTRIEIAKQAAYRNRESWQKHHIGDRQGMIGANAKLYALISFISDEAAEKMSKCWAEAAEIHSEAEEYGDKAEIYKNNGDLKKADEYQKKSEKCWNEVDELLYRHWTIFFKGLEESAKD